MHLHLPPRVLRPPVRVAAPIVLLGLFAAVQLTYLRPPSGQDGMHYFERAADFPNVPSDHWSLRIGLLVPVRILQTVFGYSEAAYYGVPLVAGALLVLSTYWLGSRLFGRAIGTGAAVMLLFGHAFLNSSSILIPDTFAAALFTTALALLVSLAERSIAERRPGSGGWDWSRRDHGLLVAVGLLLAWAYLVREFIVFLFPVVVVVFWVYRLPWRKLAWIAAPAATVFAGELALNRVLHGSPWERLFVSGGHGGHRSYITDTRLDTLLRLPRILGDSPGGWPIAVMVWAMPVAAVLALRRREFRIVAAWFLAFWIPLTLGTGLVDPQFRFLIADKTRYWLPVLPAVLIAGLGLTRHLLHVCVPHGAWRPCGTHTWVPGAAVVVVAAWLGVVVPAGARDRDVYRINGAGQLAELRSWLAHEGSDVEIVWTDSVTARLVPVYSRSAFGDVVWRGEVRSFEHGGGIVDRSKLDRGVVVLYRFGYRLLPGGYAGLPDFFHRAPTMRSVVLHRDDKSLVVFRLEPPTIP